MSETNEARPPGPITDDDGNVIGASVVKTWLEPESLPIQFVNEFALQIDAGALVFVAGQLTPPILLGSDDDKREQLEKIGFVPIIPVARVAFTRERLTELKEIVDKMIDVYDSMFKPGGEHSGS